MKDFFSANEQSPPELTNEHDVVVTQCKRSVSVRPGPMIDAIALITGKTPAELITKWIQWGIYTSKENMQ